MLANSVARMLEQMNSAMCILWSKFQKKLQPSDKTLVTLGQVRNINEDVLNWNEYSRWKQRLCWNKVLSTP